MLFPLSFILYFIKSIIVFRLKKYPYHPSAFCHYLVPAFLEFVAIILLGVLSWKAVQFTYYYSLIVLIRLCIYVFVFLCMSFMVSLLNDIQTFFLSSIRYDLSNYLQYDFRTTGRYGSDYAYFYKKIAYTKYKRYTANTVADKKQAQMCTICQCEFDENDVSANELLHCGHLYHKDCIRNYESHTWKSNSTYTWGRYIWNSNSDSKIYPYCECPNCRSPYHSRYERYKYQENYENILKRWYPYTFDYGARFLENNVWSDYNYNDTYMTKAKQTAKDWVDNARYHGGWRFHYL